MLLAASGSCLKNSRILSLIAVAASPISSICKNIVFCIFYRRLKNYFHIKMSSRSWLTIFLQVVSSDSVSFLCTTFLIEFVQCSVITVHGLALMWYKIQFWRTLSKNFWFLESNTFKISSFCFSVIQSWSSNLLDILKSKRYTNSNISYCHLTIHIV